MIGITVIKVIIGTIREINIIGKIKSLSTVMRDTVEGTMKGGISIEEALLMMIRVKMVRVAMNIPLLLIQAIVEAVDLVPCKEVIVCNRLKEIQIGSQVTPKIFSIVEVLLWWRKEQYRR